MTTILAAIDNSPAARPILETARALADLFRERVEAIHVHDGAATTAQAMAAAAGVPLQLFRGNAGHILVEALGDPNVTTGVFGVRGRRPIGQTVMAVVQRAIKPVVVVPQELSLQKRRPPERVLVPLDGTATAARACRPAIKRLREAGVDVIVLHVFHADRMPRFWDQPQHAHDAWGQEFLARHINQPGVHLRLQSGWPPAVVLDVAASERVDMIGLAWAQDLSPDRAPVVREVLGRASTPVILLPLVSSERS